jgi:hypothetical protein
MRRSRMVSRKNYPFRVWLWKSSLLQDALAEYLLVNHNKSCLLSSVNSRSAIWTYTALSTLEDLLLKLRRHVSHRLHGIILSC